MPQRQLRQALPITKTIDHQCLPIAMTGCLYLHAGSLVFGPGSYVIGVRSQV